MTVYRYTDPTTGVEVVDCDYCIAGRVPATHHVLGAGLRPLPLPRPAAGLLRPQPSTRSALTDPPDPAAPSTPGPSG